MGPDENIYLPGSSPGEDLTLFLLCLKAAEHVRFNLVGGHPFSEGIIVLFGENRRRDKKCRLFAVHHRFKGRPDGDLGFPETHIPANQSVHRLI